MWLCYRKHKVKKKSLVFEMQNTRNAMKMKVLLKKAAQEKIKVQNTAFY